MRFLTCTMADQLAMELRTNVDKLEKQVKSLSKKANTLATKKSYPDLDTKLELLISADNLKKKAG
jgi:hypothetical protein